MPKQNPEITKLKKEFLQLSKANPEHDFRIHYCRLAHEYVVQEKPKFRKIGRLCLHN
jgi:hypothetical protein